MRTTAPLLAAALLLAACTKQEPATPATPVASPAYYWVEAHVRTPQNERLDMQVHLNGTLQQSAADMISWKTAKFWATPGDTVVVRWRLRQLGSKVPGLATSMGPGCFRMEAWRVTERTVNELVCDATGGWQQYTWVLP